MTIQTKKNDDNHQNDCGGVITFAQAQANFCISEEELLRIMTQHAICPSYMYLTDSILLEKSQYDRIKNYLTNRSQNE